MPKKTKKIWFVVTDSAHAHVFSLNEAGVGLDSVKGIEISGADAQLPARELKSDAPGRAFGSSRDGVRHAIEPRHDYHKQEKHKFIERLADALDKAHATKQYDALVLVAPPRSLGELRLSLSNQVRASVEHELAKDLTKHPEESLWPHLAPIAQQIVRSIV